MAHEQPTNQDILEAVNSFATNVETRFQSLEERVGGVETRLGGLETRLGGVETRLGGLETRVGGIENKMVTKDYLDEKLYDLRGDLISLTRKEDAKLGTLVRILEKRKVINQNEARQIRELETFTQ